MDHYQSPNPRVEEGGRIVINRTSTINPRL